MDTLARKRFERAFVKMEEKLVGDKHYISSSEMLDDKEDMNWIGLFFRGIYENDVIGVTHGGAMMTWEDALVVDDYHFGKASNLVEGLLKEMGND